MGSASWHAEIAPAQDWTASYAWTPPADLSGIRLRFSVAPLQGDGFLVDRVVPFTTGAIGTVD